MWWVGAILYAIAGAWAIALGLAWMRLERLLEQIRRDRALAESAREELRGRE